MPSLLHFRVPGPGLPTFGPQTSSPGFLLVCVLYSGRMAHAQSSPVQSSQGSAEDRGAVHRGLHMPLTKEGMRGRTGKTTSQQLRKVKGSSLPWRNHGTQMEEYADLLSWDY